MNNAIGTFIPQFFSVGLVGLYLRLSLGLYLSVCGFVVVCLGFVFICLWVLSSILSSSILSSPDKDKPRQKISILCMSLLREEERYPAKNYTMRISQNIDNGWSASFLAGAGTVLTIPALWAFHHAGEGDESVYINEFRLRVMWFPQVCCLGLVSKSRVLVL
jgi:hypothetical protein